MPDITTDQAAEILHSAGIFERDYILHFLAADNPACVFNGADLLAVARAAYAAGMAAAAPKWDGD